MPFLLSFFQSIQWNFPEPSVCHDAIAVMANIICAKTVLGFKFFSVLTLNIVNIENQQNCFEFSIIFKSVKGDLRPQNLRASAISI